MFRVRFSLRAFLLLLFITSLVGSNLFTAWQLDKVRQENAQLHKELGYLKVSDPTKIHVVAVPTYEEMLWRWRIYVPQGQSLHVCTATHNIPQHGFPDVQGMTALAQGEYLLTAAVRQNRHGKWQLTIANPNSSSSLGIDDTDATWLVDSPGWESSQAGLGATEAVEPGAPFVLLRARTMVNVSRGVSTSSSKPTEQGVMLWVTE
jgi:hypothetical protein